MKFERRSRRCARLPAREQGRRGASDMLGNNLRSNDMRNETWYDRAGGELVLSVKEKPNTSWGAANATPIYKDGQGHVMQTPGREFLVHPKSKKQYWRTQG
jgi:hypothetical protein